MPGTIKAYTVNNKDDTYTIVLNARLSHEQHLVSYKHELMHIINGDYNSRCNDVGIIEINAHHGDHQETTDDDKDDEFCNDLYHHYLVSDDKDKSFPLSDCKKEWGID